MHYNSLFLAVVESKLSSGREFLIVFMENLVEHPVNVTMEVFVGTLKTEEPTFVTVSHPIADGGRSGLRYLLSPREVHKVYLNHIVMQVIILLDIHG